MPGAQPPDGLDRPPTDHSWEEEPMSLTDPDLHDSDLLVEIELYGELVIAASDSTEPLSADRIDELLGLAREHPRVDD